MAYILNRLFYPRATKYIFHVLIRLIYVAYTSSRVSFGDSSSGSTVQRLEKKNTAVEKNRTIYGKKEKNCAHHWLLDTFNLDIHCVRKKETNCFFVIYPIKLGQFDETWYSVS